jgi:hypothetical protein
MKRSPEIKALRDSLWGRITKVRFFWLLAALIAFILVTPSFPSSTGGEWESVSMGLVIFFAAIYVSQGTNRLGIAAALLLIIVINAVLNFFLQSSHLLDLVLLFSMLITLAYTSICVLTFVLEDGQVGAEHIYGAICAYVLIAMAFATIDTALEMIQPGSFSNVRALTHLDRPWWQFFYFSFSTLSTVGYGDIVPLTMRARSIVVIEQMIAVFYVAIVIARLTGMYASSPRK